MAVLKVNGKPGVLEMTFWTKVVSSVLAALLVAAALGSVSAALQIRTLAEVVDNLKEHQTLLLINSENLRDRVSHLEGRHDESESGVGR